MLMQHDRRPGAKRALDLTRDVPRSGRQQLSGFAWLGRMTDKARAKQADTLGEYVSLCPFDKGFLSRTGIAEDEFLELIARDATDDEIGSYFERHVAPGPRKTANAWVLVDMAGHLDEQDREERRAA